MAELEQRTLLACKLGDESAWREVFANYYPLAKWVVVHILYQVDDFTIRTIAQDAMVSLVENIGKINDVQHLKRFVTRVTRNRCIDYIRQNKNAFEELPENIPYLDEASLDEETLEALHNAVNELKEPCNSMIRRRFLDGLSYKEIAASINVGIEQIGIRISRCLGYIRTSLEKTGIPWRDIL